jgi:hypothetical protein
MPTTPFAVGPRQMDWPVNGDTDSDTTAEIQKNQGLYDAAVAKCNVDVKESMADIISRQAWAELQGVINTYLPYRCFPEPASEAAYCDELNTDHWAGLYIESCAIGGIDNGCMVPNYGDTADTASACLTALTAAVSPAPAPPAPPATSGAATASAFAGLALAVAAIVA